MRPNEWTVPNHHRKHKSTSTKLCTIWFVIIYVFNLLGHMIFGYMEPMAFVLALLNIHPLVVNLRPRNADGLICFNNFLDIWASDQLHLSLYIYRKYTFKLNRIRLKYFRFQFSSFICGARQYRRLEVFMQNIS